VKPVLAWIKGNVLIVVFGGLILLMIPAAWFVSSWWSGKIRTGQEQTAKKAWDTIAAAKIEYTVPLYEPGQPGLSIKDVPNRAMIEWFKNQRTALKGQADNLVKKAEEFNKGVGADAQAVGRAEHKPMVDGLFPPPASKEEELNKLNEMEDTLLGLKGRPNPYQQILDRARAGGPADPLQMAETLRDMQSSEKEKITANKRDLTTDEQAKLFKQLADQRLAEIQSRVAAISVYGTLDAFPHAKGSGIPTGSHIEADLIEPAQFFKYQWDYWLLDDLVAAVRVANTTESGKLTNVDKSVVKRIVSIELEAPDGLEDSSEEMGSRGANANAAPAVAAAPGMAPSDPFRSISARLGGPGNTYYDIRRAKLTVIVSSARVQEFLEAIPRTNFMTVVDLDLTDVNAWDDLKKGYYYGPEHVVKATVGVETVWLRSWMSGYMPSRLKQALKIPEPVPAPDAAAPGGTPAPAGKGGHG
jgi:hypothetical protein